jgi:NTE family protein
MTRSGRRIGLALGSGAARGWAHVGVIRGLLEAGVEPEVVCGSSIGAVVGAAYAYDRLEAFEAWVRRLDWRQVAAYIDLSLRGGLIKGRRVFDAIALALPDTLIDRLPRPFAAVATDLASGEEVWLRTGSLHDALRASVALPGFVAPAHIGERWLVDGGLVNPVPVSLCRALGAEKVIAVDLNADLVGRRLGGRSQRAGSGGKRSPTRRLKPRPKGSSMQGAMQELVADLRRRLGWDEDRGDGDAAPSIYEVVANSVNIMQVRISRSRMAGDPPDLMVAPRLADFALLDFDRAAEAIEAGRAAVRSALVESPYWQNP